MAFSVNNVLSNSSSSTIDCLEGKKSLLFLKNIVALSSSCGNFFSDYNWQNKVLGLTNRLKSLHKDPDSIGKELRVLKLVEASLESYSLKQIFYAALSETTGINQNSLAKDQEIHLNQIYTEQFLTWTQDEIEKLPQTSILLLLTIYHAFSDLSTCLNKNIWQELLSLSGWNESQKKSLNQFKSKYEFLTGFSSLNFPLIKLENTINTLEPVGIKKLKDQCGLWIKIIELLIKALDEEQKKYLSGFLDVSQTLLREVEKASDKDFIDGFKQLVKRILPKLKQTKKSYDKRISDNLTVLELYKQAHLQVMDDLKTLDVLQKVKKGFNALQMCTDSLKNILQNPSSGSLLGGQAFSNVGEMLSELLKEPQEPQEPQNAQSKVKEAQLVEKCKKEENSNFTLKKESILAVLFLSECLINLLEKESQRLKQLEEEKRIAYEAAIKKSEECYIDSFEIHKGSKQNLVERSPSLERDSIKSESDTEDSEEESSTGSSFDSSDTISQKFYSFNEINLYLTQLKEGESTQLNGFLSQAVDSLLKPLKTHLLRAKAADDLKDLCDLQTKEIYDHLLLGTAGLELIIQAVYDQRTDHIVLGFRAALLHCYYAIEQRLSQKIILRTNKRLDKADQDHNLLRLAEAAEIAGIKEWKHFLQEMTLHLAFSYPGDHRLFFQQGNNRKAFSLLDDLSSPSLDKKGIEEALEFCFEMYSKSLAFIIEISSIQIEDHPKLLHIMQELKEQMISTLPSAEKILLTPQSVVQLEETDPTLMKVRQVLGVLHPFLGDLDSLSPYAHEWDQKIYAAISTAQSYLEWIKISLEIPQNSSYHSLQEIIKVETVANIDKLFKHLFRAVILLEDGEDDHQHNLIELFAPVADFYQKDDEQTIRSHLKDINLGIGHHYLHTRKNNSKLYSIYNKSLVQAYSLLNISDENTAVSKKTKKAARGLQKNIGKINKLVNQSLDLFMEFLEPTLEEIKNRFSITAVA